MGSPTLGSSNLPIIGENRFSRKWLNKTERRKQGFKVTFNRELSTKQMQKNNLPSTAYESLFRDKQKFHSTKTKTHIQC